VNAMVWRVMAMQVGVQNPVRSNRTSKVTRGLAWGYVSARLKWATN